AVAGAHPGDAGDHVHAAHHLAEHRVAEVAAAVVEEVVVLVVMKNWLVAESTTWVRAMAMVPRSLRRPLSASFLIGLKVSFSRMSASKPPPWIMKLGITRWNWVPL